MRSMSSVFPSLAALLSAYLLICSANADVLSTAQIDAIVERSLKVFDIPGVAVAVVKDDKVVLSKGYGVRSLNTRLPVDNQTVFGIASNTKAFTAAALAMLVDEKKIKWTDQVTSYIPEFRMSNPYVTNEFTILDLLTHRSGLGLGAGDLMIWPSGSDFTVSDVLHALPLLRTTSSFRSQYAYDNNLYIVAGEVIARVSGMKWEDFVEKRILRALHMNNSATSLRRVKDRKNFADAHVSIDNKEQVIQGDFGDLGNAASGIYSNVSDMSQWMRTQLLGGAIADAPGQRLFSADAQTFMWTPHTIIPTPKEPGPYNSHFLNYGLGWILTDVNGYKQIRHDGALTGMTSLVTLIPEIKMGVIVLANGDAMPALRAITDTIKDGYFGIPSVDRIAEYHGKSQSNTDTDKSATDAIWDTVKKHTKSGNIPVMDPALFVGTYRDGWLGDVVITLERGKLIFASKRSPRLSGEMFFYKGNTFVVKWFERSLEADAFATFSLGSDGKPRGLKMEAISDFADFSYDFQDLDFSIVTGNDDASGTPR